MSDPLLWQLNRSTGFVLLALLTVVVVLGVLAGRGDARRRVPRFALQHLHRDLALLAAILVVVHVGTAVLDEYVDIRWWQAVVPWDLHYQPRDLALGIVALDLAVAVVLSSLLRDHLSLAGWSLLHQGSYAAWALAVLHGLGIGTDTDTPGGRAAYAVSAVLVLAAVLLRTTRADTTTPTRERQVS